MVSALTRLISVAEGPGALAALLASAATLTRFVWLALIAHTHFKLKLRPRTPQRDSVRPEMLGFSASSLPQPNEGTPPSDTVLQAARPIFVVLLVVLGAFEPAWRLSLILASKQLTIVLMCITAALKAVLLLAFTVVIASSIRVAAALQGEWFKRGSQLTVVAGVAGLSLSLCVLGLPGVSEAPAGRLVVLCENVSTARKLNVCAPF